MAHRAANISYMRYLNMSATYVRNCTKSSVTSRIKNYADRDDVFFKRQTWSDGKITNRSEVAYNESAAAAAAKAAAEGKK